MAQIIFEAFLNFTMAVVIGIDIDPVFFQVHPEQDMEHDNPPTGVSGRGHPPYEEELREMGKSLRQEAPQIMERWFERATEEEVHADPKEHDEVMDDLLHMVQSIGVTLENQTSTTFDEATRVAQDHGRQRASFGWGIVNLVKDYEILHGVLLEHFGESWAERLTYRQSAVLATVIDRAIGSAVEAYNEKVDREKDEQIREQRAALRQLTFDLTEAEHREREQIARTLHDELQQIIVAAQMNLQASLQSSQPDRSTVEEISRLLKQMLHISRNVTADLHPSILENRDLPAALEWLGDTFQHRFGLTVTVERHGSPPADPGPLPLRRLAFDTIRELLFNVVKHGKTDRAWLRIFREDESAWTFEVEDRGTGFSEAKLEEAQAGELGRSGLGLNNVSRRIREIGGTVRVDSQPGKGTRITLTVPSR